jgi:hypothetical protein
LLSARLNLSLRASLTILKTETALLNSLAEKNIISQVFGLSLASISLISSSLKNFKIGDFGHSTGS